MLTRERIADLAGMITTAAVVGVGYALGGTIGAGVMAGIGINLGSTIIQNGSAKLKERWVAGRDGIHNHDIQQALQRAVLKALTHLEEGYFRRGQANALPTHEQISIRELFKELRSHLQRDFPARVERTIQEHRIETSLNDPPEIARDRLWERINGPSLLRNYNEDLTSFLRQYLQPEVQFWFFEELKTDSPACNRAWRAFQRVLLEGIQADVQAIQAGQEEIRKDLHTIEVVRRQLETLRDVVDRRVPDEPFLQALEAAVHDIGVLLQEVASTTRRTDGKVDVVGADVKEIKAGVRKLLEAGSLQSGARSDDAESPPATSPPAVTQYFTGREVDVQRVLGQLRDARLVTLTGLGGIGKSELAKEVGHKVQGQEWAADGVSYIDLQSATDARAVMSTLSLRLGLQPAATVEALAQQLGGRRLYILDDLHQALVNSRQEVRWLVRALYDYAAPARFLCTSREEVGLPGIEHPVSLGRLLPPHDAVLFRALAAGSRYTWQVGDEERLETLLHDLQGYPLALTIAASWIRDASLQTFLQQWERRRTAALKVPGMMAGDVDRFSSVEYSMTLSVEHLPRGEPLTLFTLFADLPAGATAETIEAMLGDSGHEAITLLVRRSLIEASDGRYAMLVPVREFAARFRDDTCVPLREKLDAYLLGLAEQWGEGDAWFTQKGEAVRLLVTELPNLHAALDRAQARRDQRFLARMTDALSDFYGFALRSAEAIQRLEGGIVAARALGNRLGEANCVRSLGHIHRQRDDYEQAQVQYEAALALHRALGDRYSVASTLWFLGRLHAGVGNLQDALNWMTQAARLYEEVGLTYWATRVREEAEALQRGEAERDT